MGRKRERVTNDQAGRKAFIQRSMRQQRGREQGEQPGGKREPGIFWGSSGQLCLQFWVPCNEARAWSTERLNEHSIWVFSEMELNVPASS